MIEHGQKNMIEAIFDIKVNHPKIHVSKSQGLWILAFLLLPLEIIHIMTKLMIWHNGLIKCLFKVMSQYGIALIGIIQIFGTYTSY